MKPVSRLLRAVIGTALSTQLWIAAVVMTGGQALLTATPAAACSDESITGTICTFAFSFCPRGFLPADGSVLEIGQHQALFSLLGPTFGGDGKTTFALPDLRGRSTVGTGTPPGGTELKWGQKIGQSSVMLTLAETGVPSHSHGATFVAQTGTMPVKIPAQPSTLAVTSSLAMKKTTGQASPTANGFFLGQGGAASLQAPIYVDPSSTAATATLGGLSVDMTGTPAIPETTASFNGVVGGVVTVAPAGTSPTKAVSTQSPAMAVVTCVLEYGLYPARP